MLSHIVFAGSKDCVAQLEQCAVIPQSYNLSSRIHLDISCIDALTMNGVEKSQVCLGLYRLTIKPMTTHRQ